MAAYSKTSPYYTTLEKGQYLDILNQRAVPLNTDDVQWTVTSQYENRPDLLAHDLYGDVNLWWVFAVRNKDVIKDPIYDMSPGTVIYIPKKATLFKSLGI